eukprot:8143685-Alexandrium_andersonii.AAC.1
MVGTGASADRHGFQRDVICRSPHRCPPVLDARVVGLGSRPSASSGLSAARWGLASAVSGSSAGSCLSA